MRHFLLLPSCLALCACAGLTAPRPETSIDLDIPATYRAASSSGEKKVSTGWVSQFQDGKLSSLVAEAIRHNQNLEIAASRLRSAKAGTIIGRAASLPDINASGGTSASYDSFSNSSSENFNLRLNASWEPDLWGRLRNIRKASYFDYQAALADFRAARLSLAANTARAYLNLISAQQQVTLAEGTLDSFKKNLRIIERNYTGGTGDARDLDVAFGRNNVASAERSLLSRKLGRDEAARTLELLLGRYPSAELKAGSRLPRLSPAIPSGLPASLLERRPDLASARADLLASAERSELSRKNLLPDLRLTAGVNSNPGNAFSRVFDLNFLLYTIAANVSQTIYSGGELEARAQQALENNRVAIKNYERLALIAFREVESALATERSLARQETFLVTEVEKASTAERFAERAYIEGGNILSVLEAQRRATNARAALINLRNQRLQNRVDLHLALGGAF